MMYSSAPQDQGSNMKKSESGDLMVRFKRALSIHLEGESHVFVILGASVSIGSLMCFNVVVLSFTCMLRCVARKLQWSRLLAITMRAKSTDHEATISLQ